MIRKYISPGTQLAVVLSARERDLVIEKAILDPETERALREATPTGSKLVISLNLDGIDDFSVASRRKRIIPTTLKRGVCSTGSAIDSASFWTSSPTSLRQRRISSGTSR